MFACLFSLSAPVAALVEIAEGFTPRYEVVGPLVMLDVSGLSRLFGSPQEIGEHLRRAAQGAAVRIAVAPTQTAAALLVLGRPGLTVVLRESLHDTLASLPVSLLEDLDRLRPMAGAPAVAPERRRPITAGHQPQPPHVGAMWDALPAFESMLDRTTALTAKAHSGCGGGGGWRHPRDAHAAATTRPKRGVTASRDPEHPHAVPAPGSSTSRTHQALRTWGIKTFAALTALPPGEVYERLGARGVLWQRLARGEDTSPMVPWVPEDPFEAALDLEWPIEGMEPLSFVLGRLLEPLAERLERADRGAAILHTHLGLVSKAVHARVLQLPAPLRDPKVLRTLVLLDLESNPPAAAIDRVRLLVEPTPARVLQWTLFERAQPSPEQVTTLLARLSALMGDSHVGAPRLADTWKPGAFEMTRFEVPREPLPPQTATGRDPEGPPAPDAPLASALRRFRLPVPARVQVQDGRPVRVMTDRRGVTGGAIVQAAGPWRTSGAWWHDAPVHSSTHLRSQEFSASFGGQAASAHPRTAPSWDRDEWDIALADGTVYRLSIERGVGQWFLEGTVD